MPDTGVSRPELNLLPDRISEFCTRWKIRELSLFGSVLRDDFDSQSDIDLLVSFEPGHPWSLYDLVDMQDELEAVTHRKIDLIVKEGLRNPFRREAILNSRKVLYAALPAGPIPPVTSTGGVMVLTQRDSSDSSFASLGATPMWTRSQPHHMGPQHNAAGAGQRRKLLAQG